jgi:hypothetical protein
VIKKISFSSFLKPGEEKIKAKHYINSGSNDRPISVSARSCSVDTCPPRREDEAKQIESSHKDARLLLEPDPRGAGERGIRISGDIITLESVI